MTAEPPGELLDEPLNRLAYDFAPRHRYFKLRGDDGGIYLLRQDTI